MKKAIIRALLGILNSRWLNASPCQYGFIGNVDAFSLAHLESEEKQRPGISVKTVIAEAHLFRTCAANRRGLLVIEGGEVREGTDADVDELRESLARGPKDAA